MLKAKIDLVMGWVKALGAGVAALGAGLGIGKIGEGALQAMAVHLRTPVGEFVAKRLRQQAKGEQGVSRVFLPQDDTKADELYAQAFLRHQQLGKRLFA